LSKCRPKTIAITLLFSMIFVVLRVLLSEFYEGALLQDLMVGQGHRPFQFRILVPLIINQLVDIGIGNVVVAIIDYIGLFDFFHQICLKILVPPDVLATAVLVDVILWSAVYLFFRRLCSNFNISMTYTWLIWYPLFWNFIITGGEKFYYSYDALATLIMILGYLSLIKKRYVIYYILFILGCFNKETTIFLMPFFVLHRIYISSDVYYLKDKLRISLHIAIQIAIWIFIKYLLLLIFKNNYGQNIHLNIFENILLLMKFSNLGVMLMNLGGLWLPAILGLWLIKPNTLIKSLLIGVIFFSFGALIGGRVTEIRVFSEIIPFVTICAIYYISSIIKPCKVEC
jgi:hypothetical protein